jgi:IPT/TIG domain/Subtilase family
MECCGATTGPLPARARRAERLEANQEGNLMGGQTGGWQGLAARTLTRCAALTLLACAALAVGSGPASAAPASSTTAAGTSAGGAPLIAAGRLHLRKRALGAPGSAARPRWACPEGACDAIVVPTPVKAVDGGGERRGLDPQELQDAYDIPATLESPQTIALVDAYGYPDAEADLAKYRSRYGLPPCRKAGGCFKKVNENGEEGNYPPAEPGWDLEAALDEDMASAACPQCHIVMVEASTELPADLAASANEAAVVGANEISNSYGFPELLEELCGRAACAQYNHDYKHAGVLVTASSGDSGYGDAYFELGFSTTDFPAASPNVIAVGGTALYKVEGLPRKWFEEVWNEPALGLGTGSGCTSAERKPTWQTDSGCATRTDNDVAAVAALDTPVSVRIDGFWELVGGTSVASPLVAGIEAHASAHDRSLGAHALYQHPGSFFDVTEGFDWDPLDAGGKSECAPDEYLCNAEVGYDGPTGLGTPDGVEAQAPTVTSVEPAEGPKAGGTKVTISGTGLAGATEVKFGAAGAASFTVATPTSIAAESPPGSGTVNVTVTTPGGRSTVTGADRFRYR